MTAIRRLLIIAALLLAATVAEAQTKLRFYSWQTDDGSNSVWWLAANKAFEAAHPGVTIDFIKAPRDDFADTMMVLFSGDTPPDIVHLASFEFNAFAEQGWLEDLSPLIARDGLDLKGWAGQGKCVVQGKTVCINLNYFGYLLFYNKALLDAAGAGVPTNWDEFLAAARKVTASGGGQRFGTGLHTTAGAGQYLTELLAYVLDAGGYWTDKDGKPTLDSPGVIEGLRRWKQVQQERLTPLGSKAEDIRQLFIEGRISMRLDGPWMWGLLARAKPELRDSLQVAVPWAAVPVGGTSNVIAMPASLSPERKALVWEYIRMVTSKEWQEKYVTLTGQLAPRPGSLTDAALQEKPFLATFQKSMDRAAAAGVDRLPRGFETTYNEFARMVTEEAQRMVIQNEDPAATARRMQARAVALQKG